MITIFNRKELFTTVDMKRQSEIRTILSDHGIDHRIIVNSLQRSSFGQSSRARIGNHGIRPDYAYEYKIYVHRNKYGKALGLIRK